MENYLYSADGKTFQLSLTVHELHLLHHIPKEQIEEGFLWAVGIKYDVTECVERAILLDNVRQLYEVIKNENELLQYRYTLKEIAPDGRVVGSGAGSRFGCQYHGEKLNAKAGPGVCALRRFESVDSGDGIQQCRSIRVLDMRDMKAVTLDSGEVLKPERRRKEIHLLRKMEGLLKFLKQVKVDQVCVTISYSP